MTTPNNKADRLIFKTSPLYGKRPQPQQVQPGEIALNTNSEEPGLFFKTTDSSVVKVGPVAVSETQPPNDPEKGEVWFSLSDGTLNIGTIEEAKKVWRSVAAPYLGGGGKVMFVAPEFPLSSDSILNDGQALPYQTLNRAILEATKLRLNSILSGYSPASQTNQYVIYLAPSRVTPHSGLGSSLSEFNVVLPESSSGNVPVVDLTQFNPETGGLIVPGGITIRGMDFKKCELSPTYIPTYKHPAYPEDIAGVNQPLTSIFKTTGNTIGECFSLTDKVSSRDVIQVTQASTNDLSALFRSSRPHGLEINDLVNVSFSSTVDQSTGTFTAGTYYAYPVSTFEFKLSAGSVVGPSASAFVEFSTLPLMQDNYTTKLVVANQLKSGHRLRVNESATFEEISEYYTKVQKAFPNFFGGKVTNGAELVSQNEHVIVAPTNSAYPNNLQANNTKFSSCYFEKVNLRSNYGISYADINGDNIEGFRSFISNECTAISFQDDPAAYEIYTNIDGVQKWWTLAEATYLSIPLAERPPSIQDISTESQLLKLNQTSIANIRYYYQTLSNSEGKSLGLTDIENDFRHFGIRIRNSAYGQLQSMYSLGAAVGVWAMNGGTIHLTNSTSNFGSVSIKSEGFKGINTIGGASDNGKGFLFEGIQLPLALTRSQVENDENKTILTLGGRIINVYPEEGNEAITLVELNSDFSPCYVLPFSLKPGSAVWVDSGDCTYRGFLATDGGPTVITGLSDPTSFAKLRIRASDSTIPTDPSLIDTLGIPYIRRFVDPRPEFDRSYSIVLSNSNPNAISPEAGSVLRLNQSSQTIGSNTLKPNVQFDPGTLGGWGRVFTVDAINTGTLAGSPQFNYKVADAVQDVVYHVAITATDYSRPWLYNQAISAGSYVTYNNRNWYAAENDQWSSVYYDTTFSSAVGPFKLAPIEGCSAYVDTSVMERQETVANSYQGSFSPDYYTTVDNPDQETYLQLTYFRGTTVPYTAYFLEKPFDDDDSSPSLGMCLSDVYTLQSPSTQIVTAINPASEIQSEQIASYSNRYRPAITRFNVLSAGSIPNPKQTVVVLAVSNALVTGVEYLRVVNLNGSQIDAIRLNGNNSLYSDPPTPSVTWPVGSVVRVCSVSKTVAYGSYDPMWSNTKSSLLRFFEVMGYTNSMMTPLLYPRYWGERFLPVTSLPLSPISDGYAAITGKWPIEFNQASTIFANTHTWFQSGQLSYSRGLPYYQSNNISRKLASDFYATSTWSGRLVITGVNERGEIIMFGPQREALTGQFYEQNLPTSNLANRQIYEDQPFVEFPNQVVVFSADDISSQFSDSTPVTTFELQRGGLDIPVDQLSNNSVFVILGGILQTPGLSYTISGNLITFQSAPAEGTNCDIRVLTTQDSQKTMIVIPLTIQEVFDGTRTAFTATSTEDITYLELTKDNVIVVIGGVEQIPYVGTPLDPYSYTINRISGTNTLSINFAEAPPAGTTAELRAICSGVYWAKRNIYPVGVYYLDSLSGDFNGATTEFNLTYQGQPVNPTTVNSENIFVTIGGTFQLPGTSYEVVGNKIIFSEPPGDSVPESYTSCSIRLVTNAEFLTCPQADFSSGSFLEWGPSLVLSMDIELDGLVP